MNQLECHVCGARSTIQHEPHCSFRGLPERRRIAELERESATCRQYELWLDQIGRLLGCGRADAPQRVADVVARAETAEADLRILREVRAPGTCQCSDDEACRFVRERDELREEINRLRRADGLRGCGRRIVDV